MRTILAFALVCFSLQARAEVHEGDQLGVETVICKTEADSLSILDVHKAHGTDAAGKAQNTLIEEGACLPLNALVETIGVMDDVENVPLPDGLATVYVWKVHILAVNIEGHIVEVDMEAYLLSRDSLIPKPPNVI